MKRNMVIILLCSVVVGVAKNDDNITRHATVNVQQSDAKQSGAMYNNRSLMDRVGVQNVIRNYNYGTIQSSSVSTHPKKVKTIIAYFRECVKKNGWIEGLNPISYEMAKHLPFYYKFSKKSDSSHWQFVETKDSYGKYIGEHWRTYIVDPNDETDSRANKNFANVLKTVCILEEVSDKSGENLIEERAYDADKNLVFSYFPVEIAKNVVSGYYVDGAGCPINSQSDSLGNQSASVVHVTYDKNGYESLVEFFDNKGNRQKNKDGAYMSRFIYDNNGRILQFASCDLIGNYTLDEFGNSGQKLTYDKEHRLITSMSFDDKEKPIRISKRATEDLGALITKYKYDKYGRTILQSYWNLDSSPDTISFGVHSVSYEYDDHGNLTKMYYQDCNQQKCAHNIRGIAEYDLAYDNNGNRVMCLIKDKGGNLVNNSGGFCKEIDVYDKNNRLKYEVDSAISNGMLSEIYRYTYVNYKKKWMYENRNYCEVDSFDIKGRLVYARAFDLSGNKVSFNGKSYHCQSNSYSDDACYSSVITKYFDTSENFVDNSDGYCYDAMIMNKSQTERISQTKNSKGEILRYDLQTLDKTTGIIKSQINLNALGFPARISYNSPLFYKAYVTYNAKGGFSSLVIKNEFDEPSYATGQTYAYYYIDSSTNTYFDENDRRIDNMSSFIDRLPKVFMIEAYDSICYKFGLKNNDVILHLGKWWQSFDSDIMKSEKVLTEQIQNSSQTPQSVVVLRHDTLTKTSRIIELKIPLDGLASYIKGPIFYTQKEKVRLLSLYLPYLKEHRIEFTPYKINYDSIINAKKIRITKFRKLYNEDIGILYEKLIPVYATLKKNQNLLLYKQDLIEDSLTNEIPNGINMDKYAYYILFTISTKFSNILEMTQKPNRIFLYQNAYMADLFDDQKKIFCKFLYDYATMNICKQKFTRKERIYYSLLFDRV